MTTRRLGAHWRAILERNAALATLEATRTMLTIERGAPLARRIRMQRKVLAATWKLARRQAAVVLTRALALREARRA